MLKYQQYSPVIPPLHERHATILNKIHARTIIPNVMNLEHTNKILYDFLYHFEEHGWAIYENMYPKNMIQDLLHETNAFFDTHYHGFDMFDSRTYDRFPFDSPLGFIDIYHLKGQYDLRFYKPMVELMQQLYNTDCLHVLLNFLCFKRSIYEVTDDRKVIIHEEWGHPGFMHHDMNLITGEARAPIQCVIALTETSPDMGGWQGIDMFHWNARQWALSNIDYKIKLSKLTFNNAQICPTMPTPEKWEKHIVKPHMKTGDVLVWKASIPHGNGKNENKLGKPRIAAYVSYAPAAFTSQEVILDQIECFYTGKHPRKHRDDGTERKCHKIYQLNDFQSKLIGIQSYD